MSIFYNQFEIQLKSHNLSSLNFSQATATNNEISIDFFVNINYIVHKREERIASGGRFVHPPYNNREELSGKQAAEIWSGRYHLTLPKIALSSHERDLYYFQ